MLNKFFKSLILLISLVSFSLSINAAWIVISPPKFEFERDPWTVINDVIKITNKDTSILTLNSDAQDFVASWETGQPQFVSASENTSSLSLAKWIKINNWEMVSIRPWETKEVPFTIDIPSGAEPWWHYWAIFFFPPSEWWQVAVVQKIWSLVLVKVTWEIREEWKLSDFGIYPKGLKWEDIVNVSSQFFFERLPVNFSIRFQNTWNVHIKPMWKVEIFNTLWNQLKSIWVLSILNEKWVEINKEVVDYLPVNDSKWNVLAQSFRKFDSTWEWTPFWYTNEDWTKIIKYKWFPLWFYKAKLTLTGAKWEEIISEVRFMIFPWKEILWWWALIVLALFLIIKYRKHSRRSLEDRIRREIEAIHKKVS